MYSNKLSSLFSSICKNNLLKIAIQLNKKKIKYKQLDINSEKFRNFFLNKFKKKKIIFIEGNKIAETFYSILGAVKSPFTYSIIDPQIPNPKLNKLLKDKKSVLIYSSKRFRKIKGIEKYEFKNILKNKLNNLKINRTNLKKKNVYVIYTSGSTGTPKGCCVGEENILSFIEVWRKLLKIDKKKQKNFTQINPLYFDNSVFDFYISIFTGSILSPIKTDTIKDLINAPSKIYKLNCDVWFSVPSLIIYFLNLKLLKKKHLTKIKYLIFGGEGFSKNKLKELWKLKNKELINVYGPSECTCICSYHFITKKDIFNDKEKFVPLGKITNNFNFKILNNNNDKGELLLFGKGVGNGYYKNSLETKKKFIFNKNTINGYKTGDLVKLKNKKLYFSGRIDNQVKFMGYRIELEEIEKEINKIKNVKENVVIKSYFKGFEELSAFIYSGSKLSDDDVKKNLKYNLPLYMVPKNIFLFKKPLEKNRNFKINRNYYQNLKIFN